MENKIVNPFKITEFCSTKIKKVDDSVYYVHTYDPTKIIRKMESSGMFKNIEKVFDTKINTKCCKCVGISLYFAYEDDTQIDMLILYLSSIVRTVKNVLLALPKWIVRLYFDESVYLYIKNIRSKCIDNKISDREICGDKIEFVENCIIFLEKSLNTEIHIYKCDTITRENIGKVRMFRFSPMSDPTVAKCIVREADGIVSMLDCHNIEAFGKMYKWLYSAQLEQYNEPTTNKSYSHWLNKYKQSFAENYFENKTNIIDLFAGMIGFNLRVDKNYYYEMIDKIQELIKNSDDSEITVDKSLNTGFDEILLLHMFRDFISVSYKNKKIDSHEKKETGAFILNKTFGIKIITIMCTSIRNHLFKFEDAVRQLINEGIIDKNKNYGKYETVRLKYDDLIYDKFSFGSKGPLDFKNTVSVYCLDSVLYNSIVTVEPVNIVLYDCGSHDKYMSFFDLMNVPYGLPLGSYSEYNVPYFRDVYQVLGLNTIKYLDEMYTILLQQLRGGFYDKYIKYKTKYLDLKKTNI